MADIQKKLVISLVMGLLFFVVNLPLVYKLVNELLPVDVSLYDYGTKCPTLYGQLLHTVVFYL